MRGESYLFEHACHSYFVSNLTYLTLYSFFFGVCMRFYIIHLSLTHVRFRCSIRGPLFVYLRDVKDTNTFSLCVRVHMTTGRTHVFDIRLQ